MEAAISLNLAQSGRGQKRWSQVLVEGGGAKTERKKAGSERGGRGSEAVSC